MDAGIIELVDTLTFCHSYFHSHVLTLEIILPFRSLSFCVIVDIQWERLENDI